MTDAINVDALVAQAEEETGLEIAAWDRGDGYYSVRFWHPEKQAYHGEISGLSVEDIPGYLSSLISSMQASR